MKTREKYDMHYIGVKGNVWHCTSDQFNAPAQSREGERSPAGVKLPGLARSCYIGLLGSGGVLPHSTEACFPPAQLATWLEDQLNLNTMQTVEKVCGTKMIVVLSHRCLALASVAVNWSSKKSTGLHWRLLKTTKPAS